jgi:glycosyltransferase involved in cell wall biosynthesis
MRVLWFSPTPSLFDEKKYGGWVASLELIFRKYLKEYELGIAFEYNNADFKVVKNSVTYYPITEHESVSDYLNKKLGRPYALDGYFNTLKKIIDDFKPDIIQCFGTEYAYGLISKKVKIPVVIHMQGFLNIYNFEDALSYSRFDRFYYKPFQPMAMYHSIFDKKVFDYKSRIERMVMKSNHFFTGRTNWDKNIVKYYSPGSHYYYCAEAIRPAIYNSERRWEWKDNVPTLVTITQAGNLKGNEMILRTAFLLKKVFNYNFNWRVAGDKSSFLKFERKTGINHEDVGIELLGMISAEEVVNELVSATMYIHPAIIDNSPNSLCEAQIIGCPVIATNVGGIPDLVQDGVTGWLYPYNEPHTLAFKIMNVVSDKELLSTVSHNEIDVATKRHDPEGISKTISDVYNEIISSGGKAE